MSEKRTFVDPETGKEIESTPVARWVTAAVWGPLGGLKVGVLTVLIATVFCERQLHEAVALGLRVGVIVAATTFLALGTSLVWFLVCDRSDCEQAYTDQAAPGDWFGSALVDRSSKRRRAMLETHDGIARWQHRRRKRMGGEAA